jgi:hypothetical protein
MTRLRERLENWSKLAWVPILFVAGLSLLLNYCNYRTAANGNRPNLEFNGGDVGNQTVRLNWQNAGKTNAWHARAALFAFNETGERTNQRLAEAEITGAGGKVFSRYGGTAVFHLTSEIPTRFLACVTYEDEKQVHYQQAFLLSLLDDHSIEEILKKGISCR